MTSPGETPLEKPIQDFSDCHVGIVNALKDLRTLSFQQGEPRQRRELAGRTLTFFRDVVTTHHLEEETELFPLVLADTRAGDEHANAQALVTRLVSEHRRVEGLYAQLAPALSAIKSGGEIPLDASSVSTLVDEYLAHAKFEEDVFLPLAQRILGRNSDHMASLGLALHIRHTSAEVRQRFGII